MTSIEKQEEPVPASAPAPASGHHGLALYDDNDTSFGAKWSRAILRFVHKPITNMLLKISGTAVKFPKTTVSFTIFFSLTIVVVGLFTNFYVEVDEGLLYSPRTSRSRDHEDWIKDSSGFVDEPRYFLLNIHTDGGNVLSNDGVTRVFEALDTLRNTPKYDEVCLEGRTVKVLEDGTTQKTCEITAVTSFWNDTTSIFEAENPTEAEILAAMSADQYPDGTDVDIQSVLGNNVFDDSNILVSSQIYLIRLDLPDTDDAEDFETDALDNLLDLQDAWDGDSSNPYKLEVFAERSFSDEFGRAILDDIPLIPLVFVVMSIFTCAVFFKKDKVKSQSILGFGAVTSVFLSIVTGYGLLFTIGVPFTSMTQILPFIMFGIGMDAAYILSGSFQRTNPNGSIEERIAETVTDVGVSIALTTATSSVAFALGCLSSIPAVYWLCMYAFPTIIIDFLYQMTFYVALMAIDERRIRDNRRDCCTCITVPKEDDEEQAGDDDNENNKDGAETTEPEESFLDRMMVVYAHFLLQPVVKVIVILVFIAIACACGYSASLLTQEFQFTDVVPNDSYIKPYWDAYDDYTTRGGFIIEAYFRDVEQSSEDVRTQMKSYVDDLVALHEVSTAPPFFWVKDFDEFVAETSSVQDQPFQEQFNAFFAEESNQKQYADDIVVDANNKIVTSRVSIYFDIVDNDDVEDLIDTLENQREVSRLQPVNRGKSDWRFFTYASIYSIWEFYAVAVQELIVTTFTGVASVTILSMLFIPHWTGVFFVGPTMAILYVDLLGFLQFAGVHINTVSYIALVMSIGLLVDFLVHILLRYYELSGDRKTRVIDLLRTMGSSVFLGGLSTFLGVIPLAFSSSTIFSTIFIAFIGLVIIGIGHGLILLPVILSICGPEMGGDAGNESDGSLGGTRAPNGSNKGSEDNGSDEGHA